MSDMWARLRRTTHLLEIENNSSISIDIFMLMG